MSSIRASAIAGQVDRAGRSAWMILVLVAVFWAVPNSEAA